MIGVFFLLGFFIAGLLCFVPSVLAYRALRQRRLAHVDYRERWLAAVALLGDQGRLTDEQVASLKGTALTPPPVAVSSPAITPVLASPSASAVTLATLHAMASWDRRALEVERASKGLPPLDDLKGMATWDKRAVIAARMKYGTG